MSIADVLAANRDFYRAFAGGDYAAMDRLWTRAGEAVCVHPGWPAMIGRETVMESWRVLLRNPPPVVCQGPSCHLIGPVGLVVCIERIGEAALAATNLFVLEAGAWRVAHHHAGQIFDPDQAGGGSDEDAPASGRVH